MVKREDNENNTKGRVPVIIGELLANFVSLSPLVQYCVHDKKCK